ncbi:hypothetical protein PAHAL_3G438900 [Panicum hallii]|uniref:DUF834 domain-containing protein n=1 Tax=Panicum hallii TaxID=206008 RepID=A0A2T8KLD3_9POAL|nr:hypothetical protein PAHAL_3G438900 [Panicum hallii]
MRLLSTLRLIVTYAGAAEPPPRSLGWTVGPAVVVGETAAGAGTTGDNRMGWIGGGGDEQHSRGGGGADGTQAAAGTGWGGKVVGAADHQWRKGKGGCGGAAAASAAAMEAARWGGAGAMGMKLTE